MAPAAVATSVFFTSFTTNFTEKALYIQDTLRGITTTFGKGTQLTKSFCRVSDSLCSGNEYVGMNNKDEARTYAAATVEQLIFQ